MDTTNLEKIAIIGEYSPRVRGSTVFTTELCESLAAESTGRTFLVVPFAEQDTYCTYPSCVRFRMPRDSVSAYRDAADYLNINDVDVVCLQHDFGAFGGPAGSHVLALLRELRMPVVTTLHAVLSDPSPEHRHVVTKLSEYSERLIVTSALAKDLLVVVYDIPQDKIDLIPQGTPDAPFNDHRVIAQYLESFVRARDGQHGHSRFAFRSQVVSDRDWKLPAVELSYLRRMTDDTGMLQQATFTVPDYVHGYRTDDNARALIAAVAMEEVLPDLTKEANALAARYMAFLWHAFDANSGRFRNTMAYDRRWLEEVGSEDCHGRALWALGTVMSRSTHEGLRSMARKLFDLALPAALEFSSPRPWAFALMGLHEYLRSVFGNQAALDARALLAERLLVAYQKHATSDWPWFEDELTTCNADLPHALLLAGYRLMREDMVDAALQALQWLAHVQSTEDGVFSPVGCHGFYRKGQEKACFDQQPAEAYAMVSACLDAHYTTDDVSWYTEAERAFAWFLGDNLRNTPMFDAAVGGCCDGLCPDGVNPNQGAEATLAFLLALLEMRAFEQVVQTK